MLKYLFILAFVFVFTNSQLVFASSDSAIEKSSSASHSQARIIETNKFADLLHYIRPNSLVLLDIDDTLMEPLQTLGSDRWFQWRISVYKKQGMEPQLALDTALMEWVAVQSLTKVKVVEPGNDKIVKRIQDEGFHVMGLTTRGASLATRTTQQLKTIGIDLSRSSPSKEEKVFLNPIEVIYKNGALFTSGTHKGKALFKFLEMIKEDFPYEDIQEIVFINDKGTHLREVQETAVEKGIPFIGIRYGYSDKRVNSFNEEIAQVQFDKFGRFMTDEEASQALKK